VGRANGFPIEGFDGSQIFTPDDIMAQRLPYTGPVVIFDDDHYYMGGVLAERCRAAGLPVTLITPAATISAWTANTMEAMPIARRLTRLGIELMPYTGIRSFRGGRATLENELSGKVFELEAAAIVSVTARLPVDGLYADLAGMQPRWSEAGIVSVTRIGDCHAPGTIQAAVYAGHKLARGLDEAPEDELPRELPGSPFQHQSVAMAAAGRERTAK
jgi:dimethylamine/trimethylamine dehydrogenase